MKLVPLFALFVVTVSNLQAHRCAESIAGIVETGDEAEHILKSLTAEQASKPASWLKFGYVRYRQLVRIVVKDDLAENGERVAEGYIYELESKLLKKMKVSEYFKSLSPAARKKFSRGRVFGDKSIVLLKEHTLVITSKAPRLRPHHSWGFSRPIFDGWSRRPNSSEITRVPLKSIIRAEILTR